MIMEMLRRPASKDQLGSVNTEQEGSGSSQPPEQFSLPEAKAALDADIARLIEEERSKPLAESKAINEAQAMVESFDKSIAQARAQSNAKEVQRLKSKQGRIRKTLRELRKQQRSRLEKRPESALAGQRVTKRERPMESHLRDLPTSRAVSVPEPRTSEPQQQDHTEVMADLVTKVGRLTRTVNDLQRSTGPGKKSGVAQGLGMALVAGVQELLARTKALTGESANRMVAAQDMQDSAMED